MNYYPLLQLLFIFIVIFSMSSGRTLPVPEMKTSLDEYEDQQNSQTNLLDLFTDYNKREVNHRSIFSSSTAQSRQQIIELLRHAYNQGWKPNLKHYISGTRFGRHHR